MARAGQVPKEVLEALCDLKQTDFLEMSLLDYMYVINESVCLFQGADYLELKHQLYLK